ncbi:MAG: AMP-binding protein [Candidatus Thermoplasmatota archaeon]
MSSPKESDLSIPSSLKIPEVSLIELFRKKAKENEDKNALFFKGKFKTYGELEEEINKLGNAFKKMGIKKGDRIAVLMPNCPQLVTAFFAAQSIGAIFSALNPMYSPREIANRLKDSKPKILLTLDLFTKKIKTIQEEINVKNIIVASVSEELPSLKKYLFKLISIHKNPKIDGTISYKNLLKKGKNKKIERKINPKEDVAILQYTGGTTGKPKGAMLTHHNLVSQAVTIQFWKTMLKSLPKEQLKVAGVLPYSHIFGFTSSFLWPISEGATIYLVPDPRKLEEIMRVIDKYGIHFLNAVPVFFRKFAQHKKLPNYDVSSLHLCIAGGESLPKETVDIFEKKTNCLLVEGYGLTEASPVTHINPPNEKYRKTGSIGLTIPNTKAKIVDTNTKETITEKDKPGELWVKGPGIMKGYWNNKEETESSLKDGWLKTGDVAVVNKKGYFKIIDRLKDMIIVSGFKVWPNEVEEILLSHPLISEAAVIPHFTDMGTKIKAVLVKSKKGKELNLKEVRKYCKKFLAPYKVPKLIEYWDELPRSSVGKILRRKIRNAT